MWIKTQKKKQLVDVVDIKIVKCSKTKFYLIGVIRSISIGGTASVELGRYKSEEEVNDEFSNLEDAILTSQQLYRVN